MPRPRARRVATICFAYAGTIRGEFVEGARATSHHAASILAATTASAPFCATGLRIDVKKLLKESEAERALEIIIAG
jgi:hypothetical protein